MMNVLLQLPAFLLAVYTMYWSLPLANLCLCIKAWKFIGNRGDAYQWCHFLVCILRVKFRKLGKSSVYRGGPCMYLSNHRSWADFYIDAYLTEGRGQMMSRMAVLYVFPMFMIPISLVRGCICFKRGSIADKQKFNSWIDRCIEDSPLPGLCLFPEGHRSQLPRSLPLKRGMLHYAYSRKMPVQIVMTAHKEHVMDEKRFCSRFGVTCVTSYSDPIYTRDFDSFEAFFAALQAAWDKSWGEVFSADPARLPEFRITSPEGFPYPLHLRLSQLFWTLLEALLMWLGLRASWRWWGSAAARIAAAAKLAATGQQVILYLPIVWLLVSVVYCYDSTLPKPLLAPDGTVLEINNSNDKKKI
eukprot:GHUV01004444.1.p1 GENE.GHUV01004444.1~~GHUV01004444.1.p1  ORF type:complete len:357 (+),score=80.43 GHUV01004444.1:59-1129(+)